MPQYLYCFETTFDIIKKFSGSDKKPSDYAVYKIGKTTRDIKDRLSEHGLRVKDVKFEKAVYDCDTLERDLMDELKKEKASIVVQISYKNLFFLIKSHYTCFK
jgi:hypothetical protein